MQRNEMEWVYEAMEVEGNQRERVDLEKGYIHKRGIGAIAEEKDGVSIKKKGNTWIPIVIR